MIFAETPEFEIARRRVTEFSQFSEPATGGSQPDFELHILLGIEAFRWLEFLQQSCLRDFTNRDQSGPFAVRYASLQDLYRLWLTSSAVAAQGAQQHVSDYESLPSFKQLRQCCNRAQDFLKRADRGVLQESPANAPPDADFIWSDLEAAALSGERIDAIADYLRATGQAST